MKIYGIDVCIEEEASPVGRSVIAPPVKNPNRIVAE